jgi:TetR/AcrR family transcriptional regulator, regulator of autoinduction and epiphytic fitness
MEKKSRLDKKRESILEAAASAFRCEGYETASMDRIAELAGASKRTVYNHFASKEVLFKEVVANLIRQIVALKRIEWDPQRGLEEQLHDFALSKISVAENPGWLGLLRVVMGVFVRDPKMAQETIAQGAEGEQVFIRWLIAADKAGKLNITDPEIASTMFWSLLEGAIFWPSIFGKPIDTEARKRLTAEIIATFLARYGVTAS